MVNRRTLWRGWAFTGVIAVIEMLLRNQNYAAAFAGAAVVLGWIAAATPKKQ